jgi:multiple sugar transport system ATP-binding protein
MTKQKEMGELEISNLGKEFAGGSIIAVNDLSISADDGEFLVIVGPSGCGKSTTLNCVAGLEHPTAGEIRLAGEEITDQRPQERDIAMVFQNYALYPHMSVRENLNFGLRMATNKPKDEIESLVDDIAELLDIEELLDQKPKDLSGGQQQRVALGRAIVREPALFLMDEPLSNLDAKLRSQMRTEIQKLQDELDITTMYVTHDQTEAMTMGDRILVMNEGEPQQIASPLELYHEPANRFVASFIGTPSMNFFDVTKRVDGGQVVFDHDLFEYVVTDPPELLVETPGSLTLGVRPEAFRSADADADPNAFDVPVSVVEPMGDVTYIYFDAGGTTYTVSLEGTKRVDEGTTARFTFNEDSFHVFDQQSGDAITHPDLEYDDIELEFEEISGTAQST